MTKLTRLILISTVLQGGLLITNFPAWTMDIVEERHNPTHLSRQHKQTDGQRSKHILKTLNRSEIDLSSSEIDLSSKVLSEKNFAEIVKKLKRNKQLQSLTLKDCNMGGIQAIYLFEEMLPASKSLQHLNLQDNKISGTAIVSLDRRLSPHPSLTSLNLSNNPIGPDVGPQFAHLLKTNRSLKSLDLRNTELNDTAVGEIIDALRDNNNNTLTQLNLSGNLLDNTGAMDIRDLLTNNKTLQYLDLSQTEIKDNGLKKIGLGLIKNKTILKLLLTGNPVSEKAMNEFEDLIKQNGFEFDRNQKIVTRKPA